MRGRGFAGFGWRAFVLPMALAGCSEAGETGPGQARPESTRLELECEFPVSLGHVSTVRELSSGSVIVADPTAPALLRLDFGSGTIDTLGRVGDGPQEYRQPDRVYPLPGDSTLLIDLGRSRMVAVSPEGALAEGTSLVSEGRGRYPTIMHPRFVDDGGRLYYAGSVDRERGPPDSAAVVRFDRATGTRDTVAMLWMPEFSRERNGRPVQVMLQAYDQWAAGPDGRVVVVRSNEYLVEWYHPDGRAVSGPSVPCERHPVTDAEQEAALEELATNAIVTRMVVGEGGVQSIQQQRGIPSSVERPSADAYVWAETLPAVRPEGVLVVPWGDVWVERMVPGGEPPRVEIFGADGERAGELRLPPGRRLLRVVGTEAVSRAYLARRDAFGLHWLERYQVLNGNQAADDVRRFPSDGEPCTLGE
jgi:hypothetical protein